MNYAGKFGSGGLDPLAGADIDLGPLSQHGHLSSSSKLHVDKISTQAPSDAIIISDAHLLFHGDFKRSGVDLVLSSGDHEVVLRDYFKGEKRAALASPDGAHLTGDIVSALSGHMQFAQADGSGSVAPAIIGHVTKLTGNATAIRNGVSVILNQGDTVHKGDVVQSGSDSTLGITFIDGTVFGLASNARMVLNEMVYDPNGSDNKSLLSLVQGTISFVAGATAKKGDMKIDTPVATMGIRGTAVLVEIDFEVPGQGIAPPAKFQVLIEPDGTTGSYILYDKTTLTQIATVNRAGTQTIINGQGGVSFQSSVQLSPDAQKIISDVFSLKFTDLNNPNTKLTTNFTDTIQPETLFLKLASNSVVPVTLQFLNIPERVAAGQDAAPVEKLVHIPGPPQAVAFGGAVTERAGVTANPAVDTVSGTVTYLDVNAGDTPSVSTQFSSYTYKNAQGVEVTATLTAQQKAAITAVEVPLVVAQDPNGKNIGTATWTYNVSDGAFDFLAAGETLTLTYMARVDNNYAPSNETTFVPFTIVVTGTNDKPTLSATAGEITERIGTGNTAVDTVTGTVTFADVDLTDRPVVSAAISTSDPFRYYDAEGNDITATLTAEQLAAVLAVEVPLSVVQTAGNTNNGTATWSYSIEDSKFDFIAEGETLVLNYIAKVDDGHGGVVSIPITVTIQGADVVVVGTNDVPTIDTTSDAFAELSNPIQPNPTGSNALHVAAGTITFTDVDLTDRPVASAAFTSFSYLDASSVNITSQLTAKQLAAISAVEEPLTVVQATGNTNNGSASWSYSAADGVFDFLADGEILTLTYTATVDDGHGGVVTKPITITVTGSNDTVEITSDPQVATISEKPDTHGSAASDTASGAITFIDPDLSDTHVARITGIHASGVKTGLANGTVPLGWLSLGTLSDATDGVQGSQNWSFSAPDSYFDYLASGETVTLTYTVEVDDNHGGVTSQEVAVTIQGRNDAPEIAAIAQQNLTEQTGTAALTKTIPVTFTDLDLSDVGHTASITGAAASGVTAGLALDAAALIALVTPGTVTKNAGSTAGSVNLSFSAASTAFDYLAKGEVLTLTYTVSVNDGDGGITPKTFVVTVTGTNDAPVIAGIAQQNLTEQTDTSALTTTIPVTFTDVDLTDVGHTVNITGVVASGKTTGLALDDAALIALVTSGGVTKNSGSSAGSVNLSFAAASTAFDYLGQGEVLKLTYTVSINDGDGGTTSKAFVITITGTNDDPVVATADVTGAVTEQVAPAGNLTDAGAIALADVDLTDTHAISPTITASAGALGALSATVSPDTVNGAGGIINWSYSVPDAAVEYLAKGETKVEHFTITLDDGHGGTVSRTLDVTITGTNDAPVLTALQPSLAPITEDAPASTGQTIASFLGASITDVDHGAVQGIAITSTTGGHGHWEYSTDGTTFVAFPSVSTTAALLLASTDLIRYVPDGGNGEAATITYLAWDQTTGTSGTTADVSLAGGSTAFSVVSDTATVIVTPVNDAPVVEPGVSTKVAQLANDNGVAVFDGHFFFGSDKLTVNDPDGALHGIAITGVDNGGAGGSWEYQLPGGEWFTIDLAYGDVLLLSADAKVRFNGSGSGDTEHLTFLAWDGTDGSASGLIIAMPQLTGGTTAFSSGSYSVGAKNDAPVSNTSQFALAEDPIDGKAVIFSTAQDDILKGGAGADHFVFAADMGHDKIIDFAPGEDKIDLLANLPFNPDDAASFDAWVNSSAVAQVGGNTLIQFDGNNSILLQHVAKTNLHMSDFLLHPGGSGSI
ncbi:VCBS domain-containing protein [Bradyrhizobium sp. CB3481]|uniref:VCBS domain-containing protein n=1 Tax=Bradyrhizobium sp. CB3481 TaxID=3039158 RepID=UPI0024B16B59|nr:VCBS domain-containing protein [Bradyrhizobium sp. CB3481]WFU16380.1 VCBS domain-containing protein [Bradyrhizobium sp. CB3481]